MAKKKSVKKKTADSEMIHFRPGKELGSLIGQFSEQEGISRGEAAKRLTGLAIRCLDVGFYGLVEELSAYLFHSGNFDSACDQVYVAVEAIAIVEQQLGVADVEADAAALEHGPGVVGAEAAQGRADHLAWIAGGDDLAEADAIVAGPVAQLAQAGLELVLDLGQG